MSKSIQNTGIKTTLKLPKHMHPILMQAFYVVPRSIQRDAWWLVDEPDFCLKRSPILSLQKTQEGTKP